MCGFQIESCCVGLQYEFPFISDYKLISTVWNTHIILLCSFTITSFSLAIYSLNSIARVAHIILVCGGGWGGNGDDNWKHEDEQEEE